MATQAVLCTREHAPKAAAECAAIVHRLRAHQPNVPVIMAVPLPPALRTASAAAEDLAAPSSLCGALGIVNEEDPLHRRFIAALRPAVRGGVLRVACAG